MLASYGGALALGLPCTCRVFMLVVSVEVDFPVPTWWFPILLTVKPDVCPTPPSFYWTCLFLFVTLPAVLVRRHHGHRDSYEGEHFFGAGLWQCLWFG